MSQQLQSNVLSAVTGMEIELGKQERKNQMKVLSTVNLKDGMEFKQRR